MAPWSRKALSASNGALVVRRDSAGEAGGSSEGGLSAEALAELEEENLAEMLPIKKPKSILDGTASGLKCLAGGVVGGVAGLVAMPVMGAKESGAKGFAKGLASGLASAVVMPTAGAVTGAVQITRGVVQTPFSIAGVAQGKQWDKESRSYHFYSLPEEETALKAAEEKWEKKLAERREAMKKRGSSSGVKEMGFYDALGVPPEATGPEIKRAYLKLARSMHPDKNPDDPEAKGKFQKLGEAYQVLSNDDTRAKYDAKGMEGLEGANFMEASAFYSMIFGSEGFEDLIGELQLASMLQAADEGKDGAVDPSLAHLSHKQRAREVGCAVKLAARLKPFADGSVGEEEWATAQRSHAAELSATAFGELLTHTIGNIFVGKAMQVLDPKVGEALRQKRHRWASNLAAAKAVVKLFKASRAVQGLDEKEQAKAMGKDMATFLEGAWCMSVVDVEATLRHVCKKVLTDHSLTKEERKRTALGLRRLGEIFVAASSPEASVDDGNGGTRPKTLRERMQEFAGMMAPPPGEEGAPAADGGDDDDDDGGGSGGSGAFAGGDFGPTVRSAEPPSREALLAMKVSELRAVMVALEISSEGCLEKSEFVDAILAAAAAAEPPGVAAAPAIPDGNRVRISGLSARPELNGTYGRTTHFDEERGRHAVELEGQEETLKLRPANLEACSEKARTL